MFWLTLSVSPGENASAETSEPRMRSGMLDDWRGDETGKPMPIPDVKIRLEIGCCQESGATALTASGQVEPPNTQGGGGQGEGIREGVVVVR
jgi:hypothetical protein